MFYNDNRLFYIFTVPCAAQNLTVIFITMSSLLVTWDAPAVGGLTQYRVSLEGDGTSQNQTPGSDTTTAAFTGLTAGTMHSVSVVTMSGDQRSTAVKDIFYTCNFDKVLWLSLVWKPGII